MKTDLLLTTRPFAWAAISALGLTLISAPVHAQSSEMTSTPGSVCMSNDTGESEQLVVVLPARDVVSMRAKGFRVVPCNRALPNQAAREQWRDKICELAALPLEYVQEQFASEHGVRAQALCGMAEAVAGQWRRQQQSKD